MNVRLQCKHLNRCLWLYVLPHNLTLLLEHRGQRFFHESQTLLTFIITFQRVTVYDLH